MLLHAASAQLDTAPLGKAPSHPLWGCSVIRKLLAVPNQTLGVATVIPGSLPISANFLAFILLFMLTYFPKSLLVVLWLLLNLADSPLPLKHDQFGVDYHSKSFDF